jgi:hypothetical protein
MTRIARGATLVLPILIVAFAVWQSLAQPPAPDSQPLFTYADSELSPNPSFIAYGDMRFTDPKETTATNPVVRKWLVDRIGTSPLRSRVRFLVCAGHIHNYERFLRDGVVYLVSGGAGAKPRPIVRGETDLFQDPAAANYHYVKFVLHDNVVDAGMVRVANPAAPAPEWETKDTFQLVGQ